MKALVILLALTAPASAWPDEYSLGEANEVVDVSSPVDNYPYCSTVDLATARKMAGKRIPSNVHVASIAATGRAMEVLAKARWLGQLDKLWVCTDARGLRALARSPRLRKLVELQVASSDGSLFDFETVRALVESPRLDGLERLRFSGSDSEAEHSIGIDGALAIAEHAQLPHLRALDLSWNPLETCGVADLARSPLAHQLDELDLCRTSMSVYPVISAKLVNLSRLCVSDMSLSGTDDDAKELRDAYGAAFIEDAP